MRPRRPSRGSHPTPRARRCGSVGWCRRSASRRSYRGAPVLRDRRARRAMRDDLGISDIAAVRQLHRWACSCPASLRRRSDGWIDARGGRSRWPAGRALGALALAVLAFAPGPATLFVGLAAGRRRDGGVPLRSRVRDAAWDRGASYRRAVTALTLFGGFASTVFWPLSQYLLDDRGWRATFGVYAVLQPRRVPADAPLGAPRDRVPCAARRARRSATRLHRRRASAAVFVWLATALALATFVVRAVGAPDRPAHVLGARGPRRRARRLADRPDAGRGAHHGVRVQPRTCARWRSARWRSRLFAMALLLLRRCTAYGSSRSRSRDAYGWSNGVMTIVRGTVPAELFGHRRLRRAARPPRAAAVRREGGRAARADTRVRGRSGAHAVTVRVGRHRPRSARRLSAGAARECARSRRALSPLRSVGAWLKARGGYPALVPDAAPVDETHDRQHHRNFDQHADDRRERGARSKPNRLIAAATASSKKFEAPISAEGPATQCATPSRRLSQVGERGVEEDLDQDRTASIAMTSGWRGSPRPGRRTAARA